MLIQKIHKIEIDNVSLPCLHLSQALSSHHLSEKKIYSITHFETAYPHKNINFISICLKLGLTVQMNRTN